MTGRKGDWLGLEMDDTVGDNDGSIGGKSYFKTHDVSPAVSRALPCVACGAPRPLNEDWCALSRRVKGSFCGRSLGAPLRSAPEPPRFRRKCWST